MCDTTEDVKTLLQLGSLLRDFSSKLTVFAVNYRDSPEASREIRRVAKSWHLIMVADPNGSIASHYKITAIPHLFMIGRDGLIIANHLGYGDRSVEELVTDITNALQEPSSPNPAPAEGGSSSPSTFEPSNRNTASRVFVTRADSKSFP